MEGIQPAEPSVCPKCGKVLSSGEWPFCGGINNHGFSLGKGVAVLPDAIEGGARWCETMGDEPVWLDGTRTQWKREMEARGLVNVDRHDSAYYATKRRLHDQELRETGRNREY